MVLLRKIKINKLYMDAWGMNCFTLTDNLRRSGILKLHGLGSICFQHIHTDNNLTLT
jgi:hypothetical protein